jgi:hypothetical protein
MPGNPRSGLAGESAAVRRRPLPLAVARRRLSARMRPEPLDQDLAIQIHPPPLGKLSRPQPLDLDPTDQIKPNRVNTGQTGMTSRFCRKPPELSGIHKSTLPQ